VNLFACIVYLAPDENIIVNTFLVGCRSIMQNAGEYTTGRAEAFITRLYIL
jgi:hypothetical protein